jgi:multiple sugar transport system ATP-binding protein
MALLEFDKIVKHYPPGVTALVRFTLSVADRELVVLVGPSGAGKTTALRITAGLETATSGSIRMDGQPIDRRKPKDRDLAVVFQQPALYPHLNVRQNAAFSLIARGVDRSDVTERVARVAAELGIADLLERYPDTLSGGEAQRVALARALVRRPKCLLLDEPFNSLDGPLRVQLRRDFRAAHRREPLTTLFVTHEQAEALALADRLVVLRDGQIEQIGTPQAIYHQPANRFVASFLGAPAMNFFTGRLCGEDGKIMFQHPDIRIPLTTRIGREASVIDQGDRLVVLGIRPEAVQIADSEPANPAATVQITVIDSEFLGQKWLVQCQTNGGERIQAMVCGPCPQVGQPLRVGIDPGCVHLFMADSLGRRLG